MRYTFTALSPAALEPGGPCPGHTFACDPRERWLVLMAPLIAGVPPDWASSCAAEYLFVPLHRHLTVPDPGSAVAYAYATGVAAALAAPRGGVVRRIHVVHGNAIEQASGPDGAPCFALYLGLALQL